MKKPTLTKALLALTVALLTGCGGKGENPALKAYECRKVYAAESVGSQRKGQIFKSAKEMKAVEEKLIKSGCPEGFLDRERYRK